MPGNLLFADINFPSGKDTKQILNYLYMLREELRYTMGNLGIENFNETELNDLSSRILGDGSIAELQATATAQGASITLLTAYTGLAEVVTVATLEERTDTTKTYKVANSYYKYDGTAWVEDTSISSAALTLAAINGQSAVSLKADRIDFTGFTTFATTAGLADGTTIVNGGCIDTDTVATIALKKRTESNLDWLDFYAGIDMTVLNVKDTTYYPDTRQAKGLKSLRLYKDTNLVSGHGGASNALTEIGSLQVNTSGISALSDTWGSGLSLFMVDTDYPTALELSSGSGVAISSGKAMGQSGPIVLSAYHDTLKTTGYVLKVAKTGISFIRYDSGVPTYLEQWV